MKTTRQFIRLFIFISFIIASLPFSWAQTIIQIESKGTHLADRWRLASVDAARKGFNKGYWIGYSIERLMEERSFVGNYYSDQKRNRPSLEEMLTGMKKEGGQPDLSIGDNTTINGIMSFNESAKPQRKVMKEVGMLFHIDNSRADNFNDLVVSNLSLRVDLENDPLLWIGPANHLESVSFLTAMYSNAGNVEAKKNLMMALSLHDDTKEAIGFLKTILRSSEDSDVREDAAFWLGQTNTEEGRNSLVETAWNDRSEDVREKAIFSLSEMDGDASIDALIALAKGHKNTETRKKAAFWLGEKASEKAVDALKEIAYEDEDTDVQRNALFALTQIEDGTSLDELIKIAKTHRNPKIRKEAIFWLGQCEDQRALDALVEMVRK